MNIDQLRDYCLNKKGTTEAFPFDQNTLVFKVMGKIYAFVPLDQWETGNATISLKCDPDYAQELRTHYPESVKGAYHLNKTHWNALYLSHGEISTKLLKTLIDHSYELVFKSLPKKRRE
ncbi:MAG TPA: MmcQ/YjbR family DNA-binding protein [Flavobacteriaceae bacterium]|nr:MmcQ/YjbR family DNA-binding protein [Flavobacteriaceae bacterium]